MANRTYQTSNLYTLLIGIDCYLPNDYYSSLGGCVRDVTDVANFLKQRLNVPEERIFMLTASNLVGKQKPAEPKELWPTYNNMVEMFKQLTNIAQPGDQVYIHYSGHGGRAETNYPELKGEEGIDEVLVPTDIGQPNSRYLRDVEFARLLQEMVDKGLVVTVVLDSCHSGGATRSGDSAIRGSKKGIVDATPRPKDSLIASDKELAKTWRELTKETTRSGALVSNFLPGAKGYILLAACRPNEKAHECAFEGQERNGALTYWLLDALRNNTNLTYKILYEHVNVRIHSRFQEQTPMLFGDGKRLVFGTDYASLQYAIIVTQVDATRNPFRIRFNAGLAQGLKEGTQLIIYPPGTTDFSQEESQLALAEITEIREAHAWAEIIKILRQGEIKQAAKALVQSVPATLIRRVRLVHCTEENTKLEDLPPKNINQNEALQAVEKVLTGNGWVNLVSERETAHYQISINRYGEYEISDPSGKLFPKIQPSLKVGQSDVAARVVKCLVHLTKYKVVEEINNLNTPITKEFVVELVGKQVNYEPGTRPSPKPFDDLNNPTVKDGEWIIFRIRNNFKKDLNVALLNLQPDWTIEQLDLLNEHTAFEHFYSKQEELIPIQMSLLEGDKEGTDIFKFFATVDELDLRWLELPSLDQPIPKIVKRGPRNPLEELLAAVGADIKPPASRKGKTCVTPSQSWATKQVSIKVIAP